MWPKYIVLDGMDGSGKGTQINLLKEKFADRPNFVFTREPGGPQLAEEIRKIVRDNSLAGDSTALFQFLLMWAAREESMHKLVMPALRAGKHVFSDRGDSSTFAFQLYGGAHEGEKLFDLFQRLRKLVFCPPERREPDLYIVFDLPAEMARERAMQDANRDKDHFDVRDIDYYSRVRAGFRFFAQHHRVKIVDATRTPEVVHGDVVRILEAEFSGGPYRTPVLPY